jgi:uncharacterized protein
VLPFDGDRRYTYGNLMESTIDQMLAGDKLRELRRENDAAVATMRADCPDFAVCNGGCPHDRHIAARHDPRFSRGAAGSASSSTTSAAACPTRTG